MDVLVSRLSSDWVAIRRVFQAWSLEVPPTFTETFFEDDGYWHAYDESRSVSLSSIAIDDEHGQPVGAAQIFNVMQPAMGGDPISDSPPGLLAWATNGDAIQPARASLMLQGLIAVEGRALLVTVTSDDLAWARRIWMSIRHHATGQPDSLNRVHD